MIRKRLCVKYSLAVGIQLFMLVTYGYCNPGRDNVDVYVNHRFTQIADTQCLDISFYILNRGRTKPHLGISSFVIHYDSSALKYKTITGFAQTPLNVGYFSAGNASYLDPITVPYGPSCHSIETDCNDSTSVIPDTPALVGILRFRILKTNAFAGLEWQTVYSSINDASGSQLDIHFIKPESIWLGGHIKNFTAKAYRNRVNLTWETNKEELKDYFTLEKSKDGENFEPFLTKDASGTARQEEGSKYEAVDENPFNGICFYRLTQVTGVKKNEIVSSQVVHSR